MNQVFLDSQNELKGHALDSAEALHDMSVLVEQLNVKLLQELPRQNYVDLMQSK